MLFASRTLAAFSAAALAVGLSAGAAQALPNLGGLAPASSVLIVAEKAKKATKARPGGCGTMMYYSMKAKKCEDARKKK